MIPDRAERPIGALFAELASETATLVRHEVQLAKVELTGKAKEGAGDVGQVAIGAVVMMLGGIALLGGVIFALALALPLWAAALVVGLVVSAVGAGLALTGMKALKRLDPAPEQTIRTLEESKQWLREQVSR